MVDSLAALAEALWAIVETSAFLEERLTGNYLPDAGPDETHQVNRRLAQWRKNCAWDDERVFRKRLQWDGLDMERARSLLGRVRRANPDQELPPWAALLSKMIAFSGNTWQEMQADLASIREEQPVAFEEVFYPFLRLARENIQEQAGNAYFQVAESAHRQWERGLLSSWASIAASTLEYEFSLFRNARADSSPSAPTENRNEDLSPATGGLSPGTPSRRLYESFLRTLQAAGLLRFFLHYPVLARFLAVRLDQWVEVAREFLLRLEADRTELEDRFNQSQPLGAIVQLDPGLSDRHGAGRAVFRVRFAAGVTVIYKPKPIAAERAFWNLLEWINREGDMPSFLTLEVLDRRNYGWVQEVSPSPCRERSEVEAFYYRAGMLVCLVYALHGADCHHDNLIAAGEHPVLIDHEAMFQPRIRYFGPSPEEGPLTQAARFFNDESVLRTGLLPRSLMRPSGESYDVTGLGGTAVQRTHLRKKAWRNINTDAMRLEFEPVWLRLRDNVVFLNGKKQSAADYLDQLAGGFERMYRFLQARGPELLGAEGPLRPWSGLRFIFRATQIYASMLKQLFTPRCLRHGMDASIELELFTRPLLYAEERPIGWPILAAERRSLLQADIPIFLCRAESDALMLDGGSSIPHFFRESGWSQVQKRLGDLGDADLQRQLKFLRAAFEVEAGEPEMAGNIRIDNSPPSNDRPAGPDDLVAEALRIAAEIRQTALRFDGGVNWNTLAYHSAAQRWQWQPMSPRLYDGLGGVALFLAATQKFGGDPELAGLARSALKTMTGEGGQTNYVRALLDYGIGAGTGLPSVSYALIRAGEFLGEEEWLDHARRLAAMVNPEHIRADRKLDVIAGAAGAALGLLALYHVTHDQEALEKAALCGEHLLQRRTPNPQGPRAWKTFWEHPATGFAHGAAGMAYTLLKLYAATGNDAFREAAIEAEEYEDSVFLHDVSNWPDFSRPPQQGRYRCRNAWCHGSSGIALSRLAALPILDTPQVRQDIEHGLRAVRSTGTHGLDTACCGVLGRAETLLVAARELGDPVYLHEARQWGTTVLHRTRPPGTYALGQPNAPLHASFHQGLSGIGYEFLRLADPLALPSILLWE